PDLAVPRVMKVNRLLVSPDDVGGPWVLGHARGYEQRHHQSVESDIGLLIADRENLLRSSTRFCASRPLDSFKPIGQIHSSRRARQDQTGRMRRMADGI